MDLRRLSTLGWYAGEVLAFAAFGVSLLAGGAWLLARLARRYGTDETPMGTTRQAFPKLSPKEYDAVRAEAARRYAAQSQKKQESAQIASGEPIDPPAEPLILIAGHRR